MGGGGTGGGGCPETGPTLAAVRYAHTHAHGDARTRAGRQWRSYVRGGTRARACAPVPSAAERQLFRVHTTGAGTEPASSIPRAVARRCGPHAREPVRGRPPPRRVTYRAVLYLARAFFLERRAPRTQPGPVKKPAKKQTPRRRRRRHGSQETVHMVRPGDRTLYQAHHRHGHDQHVGQQEVT